MEKITLIKKRIDDKIMEIANAKEMRSYLGASSIGEECDRKLWYSYHQPARINDPRVHRIMDFGHFSESYALSMLKHAGYEVFHEEGSSQYGFQDEELKGHIDGVIMIDDLPYLLEIKSANTKRFAEMVKDGIEKSNPVYFTQVQVYMKYMELHNTLFFVINKDTCEIHIEIINYQPMKADYAVKRGKDIVRQEKEPERKYASKAFYKCKFCSYKDKCWGEEPPKLAEEGTASIKLGEGFLLSKQHGRNKDS